MLKRLASQTATYGLTSILGRLIGNLLLPLQTAKLSLHDFSVLSEVLAYAAVLSILFPLGLETALFRYSNDAGMSKTETEQKIISFQLVAAMLLMPVSYLFLHLRMPELAESDAWLVSATLASDSVLGIFLASLRNHNKSFPFFRVRVGAILFTIGLNLLFLSGIPFLDQINPVGINYRLILYINFASSLLSFLLMPKSLAAFRWRMDAGMNKTILRFSIPIVVMGLVGVSNDIFGRIWLENLCPEGLYPGISNDHLIGIYSGCAKIAIFINLGIQAYRYAADPFFFSIQDKKDTAGYLSKSFTWFCAAGLLALVGIQGNLEWIVKLFLRKPEFLLGLDSIFILLWANFLFGVYYNLSFWYKFTDQTWWGTLISIGGLVINAVLNLLLVPTMGMTGAALALLICYGSMCLVSWGKSHSFFKVEWEYPKVGFLFALALGLGIWSLNWQPLPSGVGSILLGLLYPVLFLLGIMLIQRNEFKKILQK
jgi:O-antigen/teichoic acid export membrane protein